MFDTLYNASVSLVIEECCECGVAFGMPASLNKQFKNNPNQWFYCPNGHRQHYSKSAEQALREEAERKLRDAENRLAQATSAKFQLESQLDKAQKQLKRVHNGTCPCCNRSFKNLKRHMEMKHPELVKKKQ